VLLPFTLAEAWLLPAPAPVGKAGPGAGCAVLPGVLSYTAYSFLQRELGAARTALMLYLTPVYAPLLAWLVLGERAALVPRGRRRADPAQHRAGRRGASAGWPAAGRAPGSPAA
jgi:hypothetical protein